MLSTFLNITPTQMNVTPLADGLQADETLTLAEAKDKAPSLVPPSSLLPAPEILLNVPAVVIDSTASNPEKPEDGEELHQPLQLDEDPATPVISKNEVTENDTEEKRCATEEEEEKKSETEEKGTKGREKENEENENETEAKLDTGGKKNDKEKNIIDSGPVKTVVPRHGKRNRAKVNPREQHVTEMPAKGSDVLENVPEERTSMNMKNTRPVVSGQGSADVPRTKMKRHHDVVNEQTKENVTSHLFKMVRDSERGNSDGPTNKRQRIVSTPGDSGGRMPPDPSPGRMDGDGISYSGLRGSGPTASSDEDVSLDEWTWLVHAIFDDEDVDPTSYGFNREEHSLLRQECAKAFARFSSIRADEREFEEENRDLEKCRAELLRILVTLPRRDKTTFWTKLGQPDVRTLLGLLPEVPSSNQPDEPTLSQQAGAEVAPRRNGSTMRLSSMQSEQSSPTSASTMEILQRRIESGRPRPIPVPPPPSMRAQQTDSHTMFTSEMPSIPPRPRRRDASQPRNAFRTAGDYMTGQEVNSSRILSSATQGPAQRGSTSGAQIDSLAMPRQQRPIMSMPRQQHPIMSTQRIVSQVTITCETPSFPPPSSWPNASQLGNTFQGGSYSRILPSAQQGQTHREYTSATQQDNLAIRPFPLLPFTSGQGAPPPAMNPFQTPWIAPTLPCLIHTSYDALQQGSSFPLQGSSFPLQGPTRQEFASVEQPAPYYRPVERMGPNFHQRMDNGDTDHWVTRQFYNAPHVPALEHRSDIPAGRSDTVPEWLARRPHNGTTSTQNLAANLPTGTEQEFDRH